MIPTVLAITNRLPHFRHVRASFRRKRQCARPSTERTAFVLIVRASPALVALVSKGGRQITSNAWTRSQARRLCRSSIRIRMRTTSLSARW